MTDFPEQQADNPVGVGMSKVVQRITSNDGSITVAPHSGVGFVDLSAASGPFTPSTDPYQWYANESNSDTGGPWPIALPQNHSTPIPTIGYSMGDNGAGDTAHFLSQRPNASFPLDWEVNADGIYQIQFEMNATLTNGSTSLALRVDLPPQPRSPINTFTLEGEAANLAVAAHEFCGSFVIPLMAGQAFEMYAVPGGGSGAEALDGFTVLLSKLV